MNRRKHNILKVNSIYFQLRKKYKINIRNNKVLIRKFYKIMIE